MSMNISSQLISKLGSPNSKIPLAIKDIVNSAGYTYFSYDAGGKVEGKDRLVDEVGTGLIWLFGIPAYRKLIDNTLFKAAKISPDVDVRVIKNKDYFMSAIENAPTQEILQDLQKAGQNIKKTKALAFIKFGLSLAMTLASYKLLTKFKQNMTKKSIEKEYLEKHKQTTNDKPQITPEYNTNHIFDEINNTKNKGKTPSFGSTAALTNIAEEFMLNPIKNMILLDLGISGSRLKDSRTDVELGEYGIKEGSFLFFVYGAGKLIAKGIDTAAEKFFNTPIKLDAKFLSSETAEHLLSNQNLQNEVNAFADLLKNSANSKEIYDFIFKNQDNIVVKAAKESGIISTVKNAAGNSKIDTRKYIDIKEFNKLINNLSSFIEHSKDKNISSYLKKIKNFKVLSTILNVGICCFALGYVVPKKMYEYREKHQNGKHDFHVRTKYEQELAAQQAKTL